MKDDLSNMFKFSFNSPLESVGETVTSLYPYDSDKLLVLFFYHAGGKRKTERLGLSELQMAIQFGFLVVSLLAAGMLSYLRRRNQLRRDGYISCFFDILIGIVGGGNLSMRHRLERWFFGIFLIGNFFLMTFWFDAVFYPTFLIQERSIKTFNQLAKVNPKIYIPFTFMENEEIIKEMLRYV